MESFLKIVGPYLNTYHRVSINKTYELRIQQKVLELLKLKDMGQLRDKYEGEHYYLILLEKLIGLIALEKHLKIKQTDIEAISKTYEPTITIENNIIDVVTTIFGKFPLIDKKPKRPAIILLNKDNKTIYICGLATTKVLKRNLFEIKGIVSGKEKSTFLGFDQLKPFSSREELLGLL